VGVARRRPGYPAWCGRPSGLLSHPGGHPGTVLLPTACPVCARAGPAPCEDCRALVTAAPGLPPPAGLDWCAALMAYEGVGREIVARLKYRNARSALPWIVGGLAALVEARGPCGFEVVTWVPTTAARRRQRGFDQSRLLARGLAARLALPCRPLLHRLPGPPQTGADRAARLAGPRLTVRGRPPPVVLVVDDVVTTGASLAAAAARLRAAGTAHVSGAVVARRRLRG